MNQTINGHSKHIFLDTDVLTSSILSTTGASWWLIHLVNNLNIHTNPETQDELRKVARRLESSIPLDLESKLTLTGVSNNVATNNFESLVNDKNDTHILQGAITSNSEYLITFNKKDYKIDLIKANFNILILSPGEFLQYLRLLSQE